MVRASTGAWLEERPRPWDTPSWEAEQAEGPTGGGTHRTALNMWTLWTSTQACVKSITSYTWGSYSSVKVGDSLIKKKRVLKGQKSRGNAGERLTWALDDSNGGIWFMDMIWCLWQKQFQKPVQEPGRLEGPERLQDEETRQELKATCRSSVSPWSQKWGHRLKGKVVGPEQFLGCKEGQEIAIKMRLTEDTQKPYSVKMPILWNMI